jgi:hypothetical protein
MRMSAVLTLLLLVSSSTVLAQGASTPFSTTPWKDCTTSNCDAGEAFRFLLWSRQSDNNKCKLLLDLTGNSRRACDALVPATGEQPVDEIAVVDGLRQFLNTQSNTLPLPWGSSAAGFAFSIDPRTGIPILSTKSFGPTFAERPITSGKGALSVEVLWQRTRWNSLDGTPLSAISTEGGRVPTDPRCQPGSCLSLRWTSDVKFVTSHWIVGSAYGISDRVDLGVTIPINTSRLEGTSYRSGSFPTNTSPGQVEGSVRASGTSTGLGDVGIRVRVALSNPTPPLTGWQFGASGEFRAPTGSAQALLGTGDSAAKAMFAAAYSVEPLASSLWRRTSLHANAGYTWAGNGIRVSNERHVSDDYAGLSSVGLDQLTADFLVETSDEVDFAAGLDAPLTDRITVSADYVLRVLRSFARFENRIFAGGRGQTMSQPFLSADKNVPLQMGVFGGKVLLFDHWVLNANVLFAIGQRGAIPSLTPIVGVERQFRVR